MAARFYVPDLDPATALVRLPADEAHHLAKVLRLGVGETVAVFDGRGNEWLARVDSAARSAVEVSLLEPILRPQPAVALTVVQAVLKGEPMDDVIRDCTMVGVAAIQPILTARTAVKTTAMTAAPARWRRVALASAKQCGASRLPDIEDVVSFEEWIRRPPPGTAFILVEPSVAVAARTVRQLASQPAPSKVSLLVGPEGGWTGEERDRAIEAGYAALSLGPMTLRAATVPLAAAAILLAIWDERFGIGYRD
jgi:16S rRNA (uracil1498-N3)-methyltransferase